MAEDSFPCSKSNVKVHDKFSESSSCTQTLCVKHRHTWSIDNLSFFKIDERLDSPTFSAGINNNKSKWRLKLYPNKMNNNYDDVILCYLELIACNANGILMNYKIHILDDKGKNMFTFHESTLKLFQNQTVEILSINTRSDCTSEVREMLSNDPVTIVCEIIYKIGRKTTLLGRPKTPQSALAMDFTFLLDNKQLSDVTLCVGRREFPAHRAILSARSPVFRAMFQCDMEESRNNRVEINDIDEEGVTEMLRYMYTGEIKDLKKMAPHLLGIAEKYNLEDLKIRCEEALLENLSLENVVEMLILSDRFSAIELMTQVKKLIVAHSSVIANTPEFYSMIKTYPYLGVLVCTILGGNLSIS